MQTVMSSGRAPRALATAAMLAAAGAVMSITSAASGPAASFSM
jgi:hypothetical protein